MGSGPAAGFGKDKFPCASRGRPPAAGCRRRRLRLRAAPPVSYSSPQPLLACRGYLDATGRRRQPACWRPPAGLGWDCERTSHHRSRPCRARRTGGSRLACGLCLRQRTATQRVSRRRPSLSGWRERERGGSSVQRARLETDTHRYRTRHHYWGQDFLCTLLKIALNAFPDGTTTRTRCRCVVHRSRHDARPVRRLTAACLRCVHRNVHEVTRLVVTRPEFSSLGRRLHACTGT